MNSFDHLTIRAFYISGFMKLLDCRPVKGLDPSVVSVRTNAEVLATIEDETDRLKLDEIFNTYPNAVLFATQAISIATSFVVGAAAIKIGDTSGGFAVAQIGLAEVMVAKMYYPMERVKVLLTRAANLIKQGDPEFPLEDIMVVIEEFEIQDMVK